MGRSLRYINLQLTFSAIFPSTKMTIAEYKMNKLGACKAIELIEGKDVVGGG